MNILGFEIKRARTAAEPSTVSVPNPSQVTQPSIPLKRSFPKAEIGDSGTRGTSGIITEEYNPTLQGIQGIKVFDEMRKSDGTIRAAVLACTLPVRRAKWFVTAPTEDPQDLEIKSFVEHALFDWLEDMTWDDVVRQALLCVSFGVMPFEKVYGIKDFEGKSYVTLRKLAPRLPRSIQQWELPDKTFGIVQIRQDGQTANIPGSKLLIFINEREGNNWWGTSMLRAAYKHWYFKNNFYKIDALAFERQGLGVPMIKMPAGYTESDERKATIAMQNLRANEAGYLLLPPGYEAEFMNMGSSTTRDPQNSINHHNKEILQSVLAQFLELGSTSSGSGSHALSADHSDLFLKAVESLANIISSTVNKDLIEELVDLNFNDVKTYPKLEYAGITKNDVAAIATAYSTLVTSGGIKPIPGDQPYLRALLDLPAPTQEDIDAMDDAAADGEPVDPNKPTMEDDPNMEDDMPMDKTKKTEDTPADKKANADEVKKKPNPKNKASEHVHGPNCHHLKRKFDDGKGFMSWRPLTFAEQKVSWDKIQTTMDDMEENFDAAARSLLADAKDAFMSKLAQAIKDNDTNAIKDVEIKFINDYRALLKDTMKKAYEYGKNNVSKEMGVQPPANNAETLANIDLMADTIANKTAIDLETKAKIATANAMKSDIGHLQAAGAVDALLDQAVDDAVINTRGLIVNQSLNDGRNDVFERNGGMIQSLQRSEILDNTTCNFCLSMDGRVVNPDDAWAKTNSFHSNCRGIWVEILKDEENPPEVGGIPGNLADYWGGQPNELIQPPRPMPLPGTLAEDYVKKSKAKK